MPFTRIGNVLEPPRRVLRRAVAAGLLLVALAAAGYAGLRGFGVLKGSSDSPPAVPAGDQEVAWIHAATSGAAWERFVAGVHFARRACPRLRVDDARAFLDQTTAVPEVVLGMDGCDARIHIRWYKLTSETGPVYWARRLAQRDPPPLAFIGGGSSDRAVDLARALAGQTEWRGPAPLMLITTATANTIVLDPEAVADPNDAGPKPLMDLYPKRSFRFCFTNQQMARAVVDFVWSQPDLYPYGNPIPAVASVAAAIDPWSGMALLAAHDEACPPAGTALEWDDDPYSIDLSNQFKAAFHQPHLPAVLVRQKWSIPFSVGGFYRPNAWEADAANNLLHLLHRSPVERQLLVLPAAPAAARRILRALAGAVPLVGRTLVAVGGDSMNINTVFRDADIGWNIRTVPVPLVFFAHQNPVAWDDGPTAPSGELPAAINTGSNLPTTGAGLLLPPNGTDDVLLHGELVRLLVEAAFGLDASGGAATDGQGTSPVLLTSADELADRLRRRRPEYFDVSGDRRGGRGEHVIVLRPQFIDADGPGAQVLSTATLEVWTRDETDRGRTESAAIVPEDRRTPNAAGRRPFHWQLVKRLVIDHGRGPRLAP